MTIWTRLGGTKFIAFMVLATWAMLMIQYQTKADPVLLDFVRYLYWGLVFGNVGTTGIQLGVQAYAASKANAAAAGIPPSSTGASNAPTAP